MMSGRIGKRVCGWVLLALLAAAPAARAEQATYLLRGLGGAAFWGLGEQMGTEAIAIAFAEATPEKGESPTPGPRLVFSVTQWTLVDTGWVRRQWHGDVALDKSALNIALDLAKGTLKATVEGTLEEQSLDGSTLRRKAKGEIVIEWLGTGGIAQTTSSFTYQSPAATTLLASVGAGRPALATGTVTVEGIAGSIKVQGLGQLASVTDGRLSVTAP
jgi:hypothetical protein